jgi:lysophospholipase L1-like esterase
VRRLALALVTTALTLAGLELVLRAAWSNPFAGASTERVLLLRTQAAGVDRQVKRGALRLEPRVVRFRTDARGYVEPTRQHDDAELTLAFQGGSTTECLVVQEDLRWPNRVAVELESLGWRVNALNAGRAGNTAHDALVNLIEVVAPDRPDVVLLMHAINDVGLSAQGGYGQRAPKRDGWRAGARWLAQASSARSSLAGFLRMIVERETPRAPESPIHPDPLAYEQRVRAWARSARAFGIEPVLITEPLSSMRNELTPPWTDAESLARFNDRLRAIGADEGVAVVDLAALVAAEPQFQRPEELYYDGMHVNDEGSRLYGRLVAAALARDVLPKLRAARTSHSPQISR